MSFKSNLIPPITSFHLQMFTELTWKSDSRRGEVHLSTQHRPATEVKKSCHECPRGRRGGFKDGTYSKDGNEDACSTQHCIVDRLHRLQRVPDAVIVAVEAPLVGLDCACFNDEEGQPS